MSNNMLTWEKKHDTCKHKLQNDFSYYRSFEDFEKVPHFFCIECCTRWHDGKKYNPKEWDEYVDPKNKPIKCQNCPNTSYVIHVGTEWGNICCDCMDKLRKKREKK